MRRALLMTVAVLALSCGFLGADPFGGRRDPDVAPWRDLGPVTFCDGAQRLDPPSSTAAGFCASNGTPPACTRDEECGSRERCTCGGCQIAYCSSSDQCTGGFVCTFADARCDRACTVDGDCRAGERCAPGEGVCRGNCGSDGDCQHGETCQGGVCASTACTGDGSCPGTACAIQRVPGDLHEPSPVADASGAIALYLERRDTTGMATVTSAIWRVTSSDGMRFRFDPAAPVLMPDAGDAGRAGAPSVIALGPGRWLAAYANGQGQLRRATSTDGITFTVDATPLRAPTEPWEQSGLDAPALAAAPTGGLLLYWGTVDRGAIGLATSSDGTTWSARSQPVLVPSQVADPMLWKGVDRIASPYAETVTAVDGSSVVNLYFAARGVETAPAFEFGKPVAIPPDFSIGEASSLDGASLVPWPYDPALDRVDNFLAHLAETEPGALTVGPRRLLYYHGAAPDESKPTNLGVATNPLPVQ